MTIGEYFVLKKIPAEAEDSRVHGLGVAGSGPWSYSLREVSMIHSTWLSRQIKVHKWSPSSWTRVGT